MMTKKEARERVKKYKDKVTVECYLSNGVPCSPPMGMNGEDVHELIEKAELVFDYNPHPRTYDFMLLMTDHEVYVNTTNEPE